MIQLTIETLNGSREREFKTSERAIGWVLALWAEGLVLTPERDRLLAEIEAQRQALNMAESPFAARPGGRWVEPVRPME